MASINRKVIEQAKKEILKEVSLRRREAPFLVWLFSIIGFYVARFFVILFPDFKLIVFGYHIHHFYYGVVLLAISGSLAITFKGIKMVRVSCILYGLGLGIIFDEIGFFLSGGDYWSEITFIIFYSFLATSIMLYFLWDFLRSL